MLMLFACPGCGDSHEDLTGKRLTTMGEVISVLEGIKDEASAQSAKPKLKSLMDKLNDIDTREGQLTPAGPAELKAIESKYAAESETVERKFKSQLVRIAFDPTIRAELDGTDPN